VGVLVGTGVGVGVVVGTGVGVGVMVGTGVGVGVTVGTGVGVCVGSGVGVTAGAGVSEPEWLASISTIGTRKIHHGNFEWCVAGTGVATGGVA
jgi:hypothetical protein